jgi:membrane-associated phospholipid phosphatase
MWVMDEQKTGKGKHSVTNNYVRLSFITASSVLIIERCTKPMYKTIFLTLVVLMANLTGPVSLFSQKPEFPYQLNKRDFIIAGLGISSKLYANHRENNLPLFTHDDLFNLHRGDINLFDRGATHLWNKGLHEKSDLTRTFLFVAPSLIVLNQGLQKEWTNLFTYGVMYAEVVLVTVGITGLAKTTVMRKRPYLYNTEVSLAEKEEMISKNDVFDSFISGHTSIAFASAVFLSKTFTDIYGNSTRSKLIRGSGLAMASLTGYLRYRSGYHFPTDIIAGAFAGSAIGYFIPVLHKRGAGFQNLSLAADARSMRLTYTF